MPPLNVTFQSTIRPKVLAKPQQIVKTQIYKVALRCLIIIPEEQEASHIFFNVNLSLEERAMMDIQLGLVPEDKVT